MTHLQTLTLIALSNEHPFLTSTGISIPSLSKGLVRLTFIVCSKFSLYFFVVLSLVEILYTYNELRTGSNFLSRTFIIAYFKYKQGLGIFKHKKV